MTQVELRKLVKRFGATVAVAGIDLAVKAGELFTLLGASGSGKTTTLRCLAGLETPTSGEIQMVAKSMIGVPSWARDCAMVFQNYALFPHLSVAENVAYGLRARRYREKAGFGAWAQAVFAKLDPDSRVQVDEALELVELKGFGGRRPAELSGGQQQRVALARALVTRPRLLLFDEPLGALDAQLRVKMRELIRRTQEQLGITTLYVTHDQEEALAISDRMAILNQGQVAQVGTPQQLYRKPRTRSVAEFLGVQNVYPVASRQDSRVELRSGVILNSSDPNSSGAYAAVRAESIRLGSEGDNVFKGRVRRKMFLGSSLRYVVDLSELELIATLPGALLETGDEVELTFSADDVLLLE